MTSRDQRIAAAFKWACLTELEAPKPGNVHIFASGHRMTVDEFVRSAAAAAGPLTLPDATVGARILRAVEATFAAVGANTNLGIILLCAPLATAAEAGTADLRNSLVKVLRALDIDDANLAFRAIVQAAPAGLGYSARHDVFAPATVSLLQAMSEAAERDRVARQYATDFADIFQLGLPRLEAASRRYADTKWPTLITYLGFLAEFPDGHILRKFDAQTAEAVRQTAAKFQASLQAANSLTQLLPELLAWDGALKAKGINPGTSADLTVATLFVQRLQTILPSARNSG